jgi:hypothetical protein
LAAFQKDLHALESDGGSIGSLRPLQVFDGFISGGVIVVQGIPPDQIQKWRIQLIIIVNRHEGRLNIWIGMA